MKPGLPDSLRFFYLGFRVGQGRLLQDQKMSKTYTRFEIGLGVILWVVLTCIALWMVFHTIGHP